MYFCEKCNMLMAENSCKNCGKKNLREVKDDDFCFFVKLMAENAKYFEENLKEQDIPVALIPAGGVNWRIRTSGAFKVYISYGYFDRAKEIYDLLFAKS